MKDGLPGHKKRGGTNHPPRIKPRLYGSRTPAYQLFR